MLKPVQYDTWKCVSYAITLRQAQGTIRNDKQMLKLHSLIPDTIECLYSFVYHRLYTAYIRGIYGISTALKRT